MVTGAASVALLGFCVGFVLYFQWKKRNIHEAYTDAYRSLSNVESTFAEVLIVYNRVRAFFHVMKLRTETLVAMTESERVY